MSLTAWYPLKKLNGSGLVPDCSGNGFDGTPTDVSFGQWDGRRSASFNGSTSVVRVSDSPLLAFGAELTASCWLKAPLTPYGSIRRYIGQYDSSANKRSWMIELGNGVSRPLGCPAFWGTQAATFTAPNRLAKYTSTRVDDNLWHHVAWTFSHGSLACWIDGVPQTLGNLYDDGITTLYDNSCDLTVGCVLQNNSPVEMFSGLINDVRLYNKGLSVNQAKSIYRDKRNRPCPWQKTVREATVEEAAYYGC